MKNRIYNMDFDRSLNYFNRLSGWGCFPDAIMKSNNFDGGQFYVIAETNIPENELYDFRTAKGMNTSTPYAEDVVISIIAEFILGNGCCILEDSSHDPGSQFIKNSARQFHLCGNKIFYKVSQSNIGELDKLFHYCTGWGFFPFLTNTNLELPRFFENISLSQHERIVNNISTIFIPVYDDESYLIWCRKDFDHLIQKCISN